MNRLSKDEFNDRTLAILRARKIFIDSGITKNISLAFDLYQAVLADREREIQLSTRTAGDRSRTFFDNYERQKCPECGADMMIRRVPPNDEGVNTQFVCSNDACDTVLDSPMTLQEIIQELEQEKRRKEAEHAGPR